jgi:patatin-like phospholipase/acyl hydrolase
MLLTLQTIMHRIKTEEHMEDVPHPCDYFDLIGGTSTGG